MNKVRKFELESLAKMYKIENLQVPRLGVIQTKDNNVLSPVDDKIVASCVHCLEGEDQRGTANYMLNYSWDHTIEDIVESRKLYVKRTYVWVCCLFVIQHIVVDLANNIERKIKEKIKKIRTKPAVTWQE